MKVVNVLKYKFAHTYSPNLPTLTLVVTKVMSIYEGYIKSDPHADHVSYK